MVKDNKTKRILFFDDYEWLFLFGEEKEKKNQSCFIEAYNSVFEEKEKPIVQYYWYKNEKNGKIIKYFSFCGGDTYEENLADKKTMSEVIASLDISEDVTVFIDYSWQENGISNSSNEELDCLMSALNNKNKKIKVYIYSARVPLRAQEYCDENRDSFKNLLLDGMQFNRAEENTSISYFKHAFKSILQ